MKNKDLLKKEQEERIRKQEEDEKLLQKWKTDGDYEKIANYYKNRSEELEESNAKNGETNRRENLKNYLKENGQNPVLADLVDCTNDDSVDTAIEILFTAGLLPENNNKKSKTGAESKLIRAAMEMTQR